MPNATHNPSYSTFLFFYQLSKIKKGFQCPENNITDGHRATTIHVRGFNVSVYLL